MSAKDRHVSSYRTRPPWTPDICVYTLTHAATLLQCQRTSVQRWTLGMTYRYKVVSRPLPGVIGCAPLWIAGTPHVTFLQLLSLRVAKALREAMLPTETIARIARMAMTDTGHPTPLVTRRFRDAGGKALLTLEHLQRLKTDPHATPPEDDPYESAAAQAVFHDIVDRALFSNVDWENNLPARWWPMGHARSVVLDPRVMAGMPQVGATPVRTKTVATDVRRRGGDEAAILAVAELHGVMAQQVRDAMQFETAWLQYRERERVRNGSSRRGETPSAPRSHPVRLPTE